MAKINDIDITSLLFQEGAAPAAPAVTKWRLYFKTTGLFVRDDAGVEIGPIGVAAAFVGVRAYANAVTAVATGTWTSIALAAERFDTDTFHDNVTNNSRLTVPAGQGGYYAIGGTVEFAANTLGTGRGGRIFLNGTTRIGSVFAAVVNSGSIAPRLLVASLYALSAGDYVELQGWQDSGGSLNTQNTANDAVEFWMHKVG